MEKVILNILILTAFASSAYNYTCDYKFGDPSNSLNKVFHDKNHTIPSGKTRVNIFLTDSDLIISFVCVNLTADREEAKVSFASLFKRITIELSKPHIPDLTAHVLAMHHGLISTR